MQQTAAATDDLGALPEWNLDDLYAGRTAPALAADLDRAEADSKALKESYAGRLDSLAGDTLAEVIGKYEALQDTLGRIMSYGYLVYCTAMNDPETGRFFQGLQERCTTISSELLFVTLEINRIDDTRFEKQLASPALAHYTPWLRDSRAFRPHQLSDEAETLLHERYVVSGGAWERLFNETMARLRFPVGDRTLTSAEALNLLANRNPETRKAAAESVAKVLGDNIQTLALITNTLVKEKEIDDRWRHYPRPISFRNLANHVEDEVVDALLGAVKNAYPRLSHRYYALKARWMAVEALNYWDRNAPLPEDVDRVVPWPEAQTIVLDAYRRFSPEFAAIGERFFENAWIDAPVRQGKASGAFAHPTVPSAHPYLLLNYQGKVRDVMTLAHELGHGVHQVLAGHLGPLMSHTPLTLAETASVFGEQLTFRSLLDGETDPKRRRVMLAGKVEDMLNTVVRQTAFCEFERRVHETRREGELTPDDFARLWVETQSESLGPAIRMNEGYGVYWSYIPHFVHTPFYVYAYAFGDCLVNALYAVYQDAEQGFQEKYMTMLKAGGTLRHKDLLAPFGLDASDPAFWQKGLGVIEGFIDELEEEL